MQTEGTTAQLSSGARVDVLASASAFCNLVAAARAEKFPGHWSGSAFRRHPCGVIEATLKLTNEWHVDDYCSISITDGKGWSRDYCTDSLAHGNPHPKPLNGSEVVVWSNGKWRGEVFRETLEPKVRDLLARMSAHVAASKAAKGEAAEAERQARMQERARIEAAALAPFSEAGR